MESMAFTTLGPRLRGGRSVRYGPVGRGPDQLRVLAQHARRVARLRLLPLRAPLRELRLRHIHLDEALVRVDGDRVAALYQRERPAFEGLGRDVPHDHAPGAAREAAIGDEADRFAEPLADERGSGRQHLAHAGTALRSLVADDDDVARLDPVGEDGA